MLRLLDPHLMSDVDMYVVAIVRWPPKLTTAHHHSHSEAADPDSTDHGRNA